MRRASVAVTPSTSSVLGGGASTTGTVDPTTGTSGASCQSVPRLAHRSVMDTEDGLTSPKPRPQDIVVTKSNPTLRASAVRPTLAASSGAHIRRRPPSVPDRAVSPHFATPVLSTLWRDMVEHRTDPSPAPRCSRKRRSTTSATAPLARMPSAVLRGSGEQSRGKAVGQIIEEVGRARSLRRVTNDRKGGSLLSMHATNTFNGQRHLLSPVKGSLGTARPPIVLDAKQNTRSRSMRMKLQEVTPSNNDEMRKEVVSCYRKLCEEVGQSPQESWIAAVLGEKTDITSDSNVGLPIGDRSTANDSVCASASASGRNIDLSLKRMPSGPALSAKSQSSVEGRQKSKGTSKIQGCSTVKAPSIASTTKFTNLASGANVLRDESLRRMIAYCDHLRPYSSKMEQLKQRRQDVRESLNRFLEVCNKKQDGLHEDRALDSEQAADNDSSKSLTISALQSRADSLTSGLKELQRCNVRLLLCLSNLSCEVRRPLGSISGDAGPASNDQQQEIVKACSVPAVPQIQSVPKASASLTSINLPTAIPAAYLHFLRSQERIIVQELSELCNRVRSALAEGTNISTADEGLLETPLFLPSTWSASTNSARAVKDRKLSEQKLQPKTGGNLSAAARRAVHASSAPASKPLTRFASSTKGSEHNYSTSRCADSHRTVDSSSTTHASDVHLPFVGVAFADWANTSDDEKESSLNSTYPQRNDSTARSPRLVIGGGKRRLSFDTATEKHIRSTTSANGAFANKFCRARSSAAVLMGSKKVTPKLNARNASPTRTAKRSKTKHSKKSSTPAVEGAITAAQIKQAEATWETIQGLALRNSTSGNLGSPTQSFSIQLAMVPSAVDEARDGNDMSIIGERGSPAEAAGDFRATGPSNQEILSTRKEQLPLLGKEYNTPVCQGVEVTSVDENHRRVHAAQVIERFLLRCVRQRAQHTDKQKKKGKEETMVEETEAATAKPFSAPVDSVFLCDSEACNQMAARIVHCWRRYKSRLEIKQLQKQRWEDEHQQQRLQHRNVMAARLQSFFIVNLAVRRRRRLLQQKQEEAPKPVVANSTHEKSTKPSTPNAKTNKENGGSPVPTMRERFDRTREKRKSLLRDHHDRTELSTMSSSASTKSHTGAPMKSLKTRTQSATSLVKNKSGTRATVVPPLHLKSSGLSTHAADNYHPDTVTLKVGMLHRLLRAPKPLVYALRVMCSRYESRPYSAYDVLASCDWRTVKDDVEEAAEHNEENRGKDGNAEEMAETASIISGNSSVHAFENMMPTSKPRSSDDLYLQIKSYRAIYNSSSLKVKGNVKDGNGTPSSFLNMFSTHPPSVRVDSFVDTNELRFLEPIPKSLPRPFEHWSIALSLQQRVFTAAAIYAWKLIFSHTPHDDYKQRMLDTREEQEARLDRVEQRNRMILACYCVRSESEWLREASADLNFVGRIWNPKRSLDPNDPDFERHCLETYEFVENFLYQCFPTLSTLEDVPTFLMGAGIYFMMQATLTKLGAGEGAESFVDVGRLDENTSSLNAQQRECLFVYEFLNLIDTLSFWHSQSKGKSNDASPTGKSSSKQPGTAAAGSTQTETSDDDFISWRAHLERSVNAILGASSTGVGTSATADSLTNLDGNITDSSDCPPIRLVKCPSSNVVAGEKVSMERFSLAYPSGFLVGLSERLMRCLVGVKLDLDVCEDLDVAM
ncbi:uncharacterized protein TEOVI_000779300 [Trypanosoma equiperdum]|uniref:Uncharacterized protein n=1 Tax=Trypanosoma equiperdum TaxID=5694 RepID=A0A1G4I4B3_TRYEQ|nr:hypothetical protein, conserved [Trypanosoma equiperdum]